ncbi:hypothetical protein ACRS6B_06035 [Nocardia asteroides]
MNQDENEKGMRSMGSFGLDLGVGLGLFARWLEVMFGLDFGLS